jgi:hypothetical protein
MLYLSHPRNFIILIIFGSRKFKSLSILIFLSFVFFLRLGVQILSILCSENRQTREDAVRIDSTLKNGRLGDRNYTSLLKIVQSDPGAHPVSYSLRSGVRPWNKVPGASSWPSSSIHRPAIPLYSSAGFHCSLKDNFNLTSTLYVTKFTIPVCSLCSLLEK